MTAFTRVDMIMLERLLPDGKFENDIYGAAYRLLDAANMIGFLFAGLLLPMFARMIKEKSTELKALHTFSFELILCLTIPLAMGIFLYRYDIMVLLYDDALPYWGDILGYLILNLVPISGIYIAGTLLLANGSHWHLIKIYALGFVINFALNLYLIFEYKSAGASLATLVTQFSVWMALLWLLRREKGFTVMRKRFAAFLLLLGIVFFIAPNLLALINLDWRIKFIGIGALLGMMSISYLLLSFDIKSILSKK